MHGLIRLGALLVALTTVSCAAWDGHFEILGYSTRPNYDPNIRTIYLPIFENKTYIRGLEFQIQRALEKQLGWKTPYRITSCKATADTELTGTINSYTKNLILISPSNGQRVEEIVLTVGLVWKDLRTGEILSKRQRRPGEPIPLDLPPPGGAVLPGVTIVTPPATPMPLDVELAPEGGPALEAQPKGPPPGKPEPVIVNASVTFHPELAQSTASAQAALVEKLAIQIVNMMNQPW